jgi:hypothetical protein
VIKEIYQTVFERDDVVPGMVATVQSFGQLAHFHPHIHAIVTDGAFSKDGTFIPLPEMAVEPFLKLWEKRVFDLLLRRGKITPEIVKQPSLRDGLPHRQQRSGAEWQMRTWQHSGFSVHKKVRIAENDPDGLENLIQYIAFIERKDQADVIEKILEHCDLWTEPKRSLPPGIASDGDDDFILVPEYAPFMEFPANF